MVDDITLGVNSASAIARVLAFMVSACLRQRTIGVDNALRSAADKRVSEEALLASALECLSTLATFGIRSAQNVVACHQFIFGSGWDALLEGIANKSVVTSTDRVMVDNFAISVVAARSRAWVDTFLSQTSFIEGAFRIADALGTAEWVVDCVGRGTSITDCNVIVVDGARNVISAWRRIARVVLLVALGSSLALIESVADIASWAFANSDMSVDFAFRIDAAHSGLTGFDTFLIDASFCGGTVRVNCAFRFASVLRISKEILNARANRFLALDFAQSVRTARRGVARVFGCNSIVKLVTCLQGTSSETVITETHRVMFLNFAVRVLATTSRTRISALKTDAGSRIVAFGIDLAFVAVASLSAGRVTSQADGTDAHASAIRRDLTLGIRTARVGLTSGFGFFVTSIVRVSIETRLALALFSVLNDIALRISSARSGLAKNFRNDWFNTLSEGIADS